ncbi:MAG TPA: hypothetical protein VHE12_09000 [bacterium]|nr:hypothetical protein [bacterium]
MKPVPSKKGTTKQPNSFQAELEKGDEALRTSDLRKAQGHYTKVAQQANAADSVKELAAALQGSARVLDLMGHYGQAIMTYHEALKCFLQIGEKPGIARAKGFLGISSWATGDYSEAGRLFAEALFLYEEARDLRGQAWVHDQIGNLKLAMRDDLEAEKSYYKSHELMEGIGADEEVKAWEFYHRATVELFREHFLQAKAYFEEALKSFQKRPDLLGKVAVRIHLGEIACARKDLVAAQDHLQKAVVEVLPTGCKPLLMDALVGVSQLLKAQGLERKAIGILMVALSHPTCRQQTKDRMVSLVIHLESRFTSQEVQGGFQWAKEVSIEQMAKAWVDSLAPAPKDKKRK